MQFKSVNGEWFPQDEETKEALKSRGIDHLGIHVSEDPYIKNLEFITGIPRRELVEGQQQAMMAQMQQQMLQVQQALTMAMIGDKESAANILKSIRQPEKKEEQKTVDYQELKKNDFESTMRPTKRVGRPPKNLPKIVEEKVEVHTPVVSNESGGFGKV